MRIGKVETTGALNALERIDHEVGQRFGGACLFGQTEDQQRNLLAARVHVVEAKPDAGAVVGALQLCQGRLVVGFRRCEAVQVVHDLDHFPPSVLVPAKKHKGSSAGVEFTEKSMVSRS
jgi:hypothetical protein